MTERTSDPVTSIPGRSPADSRRKIRDNTSPSAPSNTHQAPSGRHTCVVEFRSGEAVYRHPDLQSLICDGWEIESAVPRLSEAVGVELLVILTKADRT